VNLRRIVIRSLLEQRSLYPFFAPTAAHIHSFLKKESTEELTLCLVWTLHIGRRTILLE
jgi:hypothetical protein